MNVAPRLTSLAGNTASPTLLELDHVSISYPTRDGILTAVEDVSFTLSASERLVLLGPSGCGKSTLLRAVGGFIKPSAGEIHMNGRRIGAPGPDRMTVFQEFDQQPVSWFGTSSCHSLGWCLHIRFFQPEASDGYPPKT